MSFTYPGDVTHHWLLLGHDRNFPRIRKGSSSSHTEVESLTLNITTSSPRSLPYPTPVLEQTQVRYLFPDTRNSTPDPLRTPRRKSVNLYPGVLVHWRSWYDPRELTRRRSLNTLRSLSRSVQRRRTFSDASGSSTVCLFVRGSWGEGYSIWLEVSPQSDFCVSL